LDATAEFLRNAGILYHADNEDMIYNHEHGGDDDEEADYDNEHGNNDEYEGGDDDE